MLELFLVCVSAGARRAACETPSPQSPLPLASWLAPRYHLALGAAAATSTARLGSDGPAKPADGFTLVPSGFVWLADGGEPETAAYHVLYRVADSGAWQHGVSADLVSWRTLPDGVPGPASSAGQY